MAYKSIKSRKHLIFVSEKPCVICSRTDVQSAHIRFAGAGIGMKPSDCFVVPLCIDHHREQHKVHRLLSFTCCTPKVVRHRVIKK